MNLDGLDPFTVLGIMPSASSAEIKKRHRILVQIWHPDRYESSPRDVRDEAALRMEEINVAFDIIGDSARRAAWENEATQQAAYADPVPSPTQLVATPVAEAVELLSRMPTSISADLLAQVMPAHAVPILVAAPVATSADLLAAMGADHAAVRLAAMSRPLATSILVAMPVRAAAERLGIIPVRVSNVILLAMPPQAAATRLATMPCSAAGLRLAGMASPLAAHLLATMPPAAAAGRLAMMLPMTAAAILRALPWPAARSIISLMPSSAGTDVQNVLGVATTARESTGFRRSRATSEQSPDGSDECSTYIFDVPCVTYWDGSPHYFPNSRCTVTASALMVRDAGGKIQQTRANDIASIEPRKGLFAGQTIEVRIGTRALLEITCASKEQKIEILSQLGAVLFR